MSVSVCLSVTEVHWRIIAKLGFKFRSQFTAHCDAVAVHAGAREGIIARKRGGIGSVTEDRLGTSLGCDGR